MIDNKKLKDQFVKSLTNNKNAEALYNFDQAFAFSTNILNEREYRTLYMHYIDGVSFAEIARKCKVTPERIMQIRDRALRKLRHPKYIKLFTHANYMNELIKMSLDLMVSEDSFLNELKAIGLDDKLIRYIFLGSIKTMNELEEAITSGRILKIRGIGVVKAKIITDAYNNYYKKQ